MSKADSIKARIQNLAVKENKSFNHLLMHYFRTMGLLKN